MASEQFFQITGNIFEFIIETGRHEADRGRHEADRGPHEAEQEKTKFLGPQFCRSGIGILRKGEVIP
ncbi:hypothetical protein T12_1656 [Trichinella patagoniensis]|uniref:Uncharacterized protein n=1 Tax=Trichinella patagoniensis TaxID=990121 RepID=A0A0V0ZAT0_9BILA|nr:hypothetical protein T12_1656 [Trichinella patagoniensis]